MMRWFERTSLRKLLQTHVSKQGTFRAKRVASKDIAREIPPTKSAPGLSVKTLSDCLPVRNKRNQKKKREISFVDALFTCLPPPAKGRGGEAYL